MWWLLMRGSRGPAADGDGDGALTDGVGNGMETVETGRRDWPPVGGL